MTARLMRLVRDALIAAAYSAAGALVVLVSVFVLYLQSRPELQVWHLADLDEEFSTASNAASFADYLALEERLFSQLSEQVYAKIPADERRSINRYNRGSQSDPTSRSPNWNRSFELAAESPKAGVLLLHGMSDSPYSLRSLGQRLNAAGASVLGLRVPGHGTAPSGLVEVTWQDMAAAVRLAMRHLEGKVAGRPIYILGYSNGAALAVHYALATLRDDTLPKVDGLVMLSPAIGVTSVAALAVWQARIGHLLGLKKLAWNAILPEYDPYKYGSFAVNAGDTVYRLTSEIQEGLDQLDTSGRLEAFPPLLAFSSVVDATVAAPALVKGLFQRLPLGDRELVLFDINRMAEMTPILKSDPSGIIDALREEPKRAFTLSLVTNAHDKSRRMVARTKRPGQEAITERDLGLSWPRDVYSLTHVALPFPPQDPVYGVHPQEGSTGIRLGDVALRGERGVLQIPASELLRLRWNPFYPYVEARVLAFLGLGDN
jgi:alpha-beta hydrolase superfamily lysophospholipase